MNAPAVISMPLLAAAVYSTTRNTESATVPIVLPIRDRRSLFCSFLRSSVNGRRYSCRARSSTPAMRILDMPDIIWYSFEEAAPFSRAAFLSYFSEAAVIARTAAA